MSKGAWMPANRANWYETFESWVQFYPKLSAAIAIETMAAAGRMIPSSSRAMGDTAATLVDTKPSIPSMKRAISRQSSNGRKTAKRGTGQRKAKTAKRGTERRKAKSVKRGTRRRKAA
jgi:hypothetical protein